MNDLDNEQPLMTVLNELGFRTFNPELDVAHHAPETTEEALDNLSHWLRLGSFAIAGALLEVADAIREAGGHA